MQKSYIWEHSGWPYLTWDNKELSPLLGDVRNRQGQLIGKTSLISPDIRRQAMHDVAVSDVMASARLEGADLDEALVQAEIGRIIAKKRFAILPTDDPSIGGAQVFVDAINNFKADISEMRLISWHNSLAINKIDSDSILPSENILLSSTPVKHVERKMEYQKIPLPPDVPKQMLNFIQWLNTKHHTDPVIKAGVAYLWFLIIRPFETDNGRIARTIADVFLSRADNLPERYYDLAAQIDRDRDQYYNIIQYTQTGGLDVTEWLRWFMYAILAALNHAEDDLIRIINKSRFYDQHRLTSLNDRQIRMINLLWDNRDLYLTTTSWANRNNCSSDTALRDIQDLIAKSILIKSRLGGRSTSYCLNNKEKFSPLIK